MLSRDFPFNEISIRYLLEDLKNDPLCSLLPGTALLLSGQEPQEQERRNGGSIAGKRLTHDHRELAQGREAFSQPEQRILSPLWIYGCPGILDLPD